MTHRSSAVPHVAAALALCLAASGCATTRVPEATPPGKSLASRGAIDIVVPFETRDDQIHVKARIDGGAQEYDFLLDTGAGSSAVSKRIVDALGLSKVSEADTKDLVGDSATQGIVVLKSLEVGHAMIRNIAVLALDFGRQESAEMKFDGIIGTNFLRYFSVEIDYKADIAILSNDWNYADKLGLGKGMSFSYSDGLPVIELGLADGNRAEAQVDTGAGSPFLLFPKQDLARYGPLLEGGAIKTRGSMGGGIYGRSVGDYFARIGEIRVGDFRAKDLPLIFDDVRRITICNGFLAHFKVVLDYPHTRIFLIPNGSLPFETNIRSFGYTVQADADGKARICSLVEGSSAQKAGLELGDLVLKLRVESSDRIFIVIAGKNGGREIALKEAPILPE